jgi:hypothetical protein
MLRNDTAEKEWIAVFADVPSSCSIEVHVQKILCCVFVAESVQDECSVKTFATAISKSTITSAVLGNSKQLWAHLAFEGPIKKTGVNRAVQTFSKRWKASKADFVMQGCPGSDTLPGVVMNAYFHMHRVGVEWVGNSRGMAACICKIWTGQALCLQALRMKLSYMASSPASMHECVTTILWVYMNITTLPAAIITTILGNPSNMTLTCDNVIEACIFMAKEAALGCALTDISQIATQFKEGLNASEEVPQAAQQSMCRSMAPNLVDFVWQSCCTILQYTNQTSTMLSRYTHSILSIWNSRHETVITPEPIASTSVQRGGNGPEAATTIESVAIGTTIEPVTSGTGQSHGAPKGPVDFEVQPRGGSLYTPTHATM